VACDATAEEVSEVVFGGGGFVEGHGMLSKAPRALLTIVA
jgi:hypothetical protein